MVPKIFYGPILRVVRLMKFLSVRNRASGPGSIKKKGGPLPKVYKRTSPQAHKLSSLTMKQYPLLWDFIRLNRKDI
jgi:hypothetical protein